MALAVCLNLSIRVGKRCRAIDAVSKCFGNVAGAVSMLQQPHSWLGDDWVLLVSEINSASTDFQSLTPAASLRKLTVLGSWVGFRVQARNTERVPLKDFVYSRCQFRAAEYSQVPVVALG